MYEIEVKVPADLDVVRKRLREAGAEPLGAVEQVDTYYDAPHREFAETDESVRVRAESGDEGTVHEFTYKGPKVDADSKTREEHETTVGDPDAVAASLVALGFEPVATVEKERERYHLAGYTVTLDAVDGVGEFVEVECEGSAGALDDLRDGAFDVLRSLDLDPREQVRTSYLGLLLDDGEPSSDARK